jgi:hypothetical protein
LNLKRLAAFFLAFVIFIGIFPAEAFANYQNPVTDLTISDYTTPSATAYTVGLTWTRPYPSDRMEELSGNIVSIGQSATDQATDYAIYARNSTRLEQFSSPISTTGQDTDSSLNVMLTENFDPGSLYEFRVQPSHTHTYTDTDGNITTGNAPFDQTLADAMESTALYLTDLEVSANAAGSRMTVTWSDPTFDGETFFSGYRFFYAAGGSQVSEIPTTQPVEVASDSEDLTTTRDGKLQYTFTDDNLEVGKLYALKVEPLFNGRPVRDQQYVTFQNKRYSISYRSIEYRTDDVYVNPSLNVEADGQENVRIYWDSLKGSLQNVDSVDIYSSLNNQVTDDGKLLNSYLLGTLDGTAAQDVNYWLAPRPDKVTYYQIVIHYRETDNTILDVPSIVAWFDPSYSDFTPYKPDITYVWDNGALPLNMGIRWKAFLRQPYNDEERQELSEQFGNLYIDPNLVYDIYVTDDIENFDNPMFNDKIVASLSGLDLGAPVADENDPSIPVYEAHVTDYYTRAENGAITKQPLIDNKVYYIRIISTRDPGGQESQPGTASHYIMPTQGVETNPLMMTRPPLRIKTDINGIEQIGSDYITIQWDTVYFEAYNKDDKSWYSLIGVDEAGRVVFGSDAENLPDQSKVLKLYTYAQSNGESAIRHDLAAAGAIEAAYLPIRLVDITDSRYEVHTARYDYIQSQGGYEAYMDTTLLADDSDQYWHEIAPTGDPLHPDSAVTDEDAPDGGALTPNTTYVIYFRPFVVRREKKTAYLPTYVMATTIDEVPPLDIVPTVPMLEAVSQTDQTLTVRWLYSPELTYELAYSENSADYPDNGTSVAWADIQATGGILTEDSGQTYLYYTITGLFPNIMYDIWVRAAAGEEVLVLRMTSAWSNPLEMRTDDIIPPNPPKGLGLADSGHVDLYNKANSVTLQPDAETYLIVEWMRDQNDLPTDDQQTQGQPSQGQSSEDTDNAIYLPNPDVAEMYMAQFANLAANRQYYLRAKTVLTVTKTSDGVTKTYNYTVQISQDPSFLDYTEITIPVMAALEDLDPLYTRRAESDWSTAISLYTARSSGEYDGEANPELYPLPDRDYEIIYDDKTGDLTFRFRSDEIDQRGDHDNLVDQRFISRLVERKIYTYTIDLSRHFYLPVRSRTVEMPYTVFTAFGQRGISVKISTGGMWVTFKPDALKNEQFNSLSDFGLNARLRISLYEDDPETPELGRGENYASSPQRLAVTVTTPRRELRLEQFAKPIEIGLRLNEPAYNYASNVSAYRADMNTAGWAMLDARPSEDYRSLVFDAVEPASFAAIAATAPAVAPLPGQWNADPQVREAVMAVGKRIRIEDIGVISPGSVVSAEQFNQLAAAIAYNRGGVKLGAPLELAAAGALAKAGMYLQGSPVQHYQALNVMARLYELKAEAAPDGLYAKYGGAGQGDYLTAGDMFRMAADVLKADVLPFPAK